VGVRLVFLGSPEFALPSLEALLDAGHEISLVITQPDRPVKRSARPVPTPVAAFAEARGLPIWRTASLKGEEAAARIRSLQPEAMALAAFAALVPKSVLEIVPILNVHPSLLPRWRGASPIQAALLNGDTETGVSIIQLVQALDAGPILLQERTSIAPDDDYLTLEPRLAKLGARLLVRALEEQPEPRPQDEDLVTFCQRIDREDARIDWSQPAEHIWRQVRAYRGWPQAFTTWDGKLLKILRAWPGPGSTAPGLVQSSDATLAVGSGAGVLRLEEVQLEGKRPQPAAEFVRGYPKVLGATLGVA
jgi:methionyl-tRNA formyltransferase